jgi:hypothetical protein
MFRRTGTMCLSLCTATCSVWRPMTLVRPAQQQVVVASPETKMNLVAIPALWLHGGPSKIDTHAWNRISLTFKPCTCGGN